MTLQEQQTFNRLAYEKAIQGVKPRELDTSQVHVERDPYGAWVSARIFVSNEEMKKALEETDEAE